MRSRGQIKSGDIVTVCMTRNDVFSFQKFEGLGPHIERCRVAYVPSATGDMWHFETWNERPFHVNPSCSDFAGVVLEEYGDG